MYECFDCRAVFRDQFPDDPDGPQYCQACGSERLIPRDELEIETVAEALELHQSPASSRSKLNPSGAIRAGFFLSFCQ